jgi:hypothetical protein
MVILSLSSIPNLEIKARVLLDTKLQSRISIDITNNPSCREYGIAEGKKGADSSIGFCKTRESVRKLLYHVTQYLLNQKLPVCAVSPFPSWYTPPPLFIITSS